MTPSAPFTFPVSVVYAGIYVYIYVYTLLYWGVKMLCVMHTTVQLAEFWDKYIPMKLLLVR